MSPRMVGVDLGATEVRVAEVAGVDAEGRAIVTKVGFSPIREGAISAGRIRAGQETSVALALQRALKAANVSKRGFVLGMANPDVAMAQVALPAAVKREEREAALRIGDYQISPSVPLSESVISTQKISTEVTEGVQVTTLSVAAAHASEVEALQTVCKLAGAVPRAIDLTGAALLRSLTRTDPNSDEIATVVDLGASKVTIVTRQGLHMRSLRTLSGGGNELTRALMVVTEDDYDATERRKAGMRLTATTKSLSSGPSYGFDDEPESSAEALREKAVEDALSGATDVLVESIAQSLEADLSAVGEFTRGITICGGTARLRGIKERIQQRVGVPVLIGTPWMRLERSKRNAPFLANGKEDPVMAMNLASAVGLALWKDPL